VVSDPRSTTRQHGDGGEIVAGLRLVGRHHPPVEILIRFEIPDQGFAGPHCLPLDGGTRIRVHDRHRPAVRRVTEKQGAEAGRGDGDERGQAECGGTPGREELSHRVGCGVVADGFPWALRRHSGEGRGL
jgi:hypothetical protein